MRTAILLTLLLVVLGCGKEDVVPQPPIAAVAAETTADPYEQARSGAFQLSQAQDAIAETAQYAQSLPKELADARAEIIARLDEAGESLTGLTTEPPPRGEFDLDMDAQEKRRAEAIDTSNDTMLDLLELRGLVVGLAETGPPARTVGLGHLEGLIEVAIEALVSAVEAYGGKVEHEEALEIGK